MADLSISTAREIIAQAIKDETFAGDVPEDDATCISQAQELVEMAEAAWAQFIRGPEVEAILKLAAGVEGGDDEPKEEAKEDPPSEPEADSNSSDDEEERAPKQDLEGVDEALTKVEPWENYNEDRVSDITEGINIAAQETPDELTDLLKHIWAYESSHKNRVRILKHISEVFEKDGGKSDGKQAPESEGQGGSEDSEGSDGGSEASTDAEAGATEDADNSGDESVSQTTEAKAESTESKSDSKPKASESGSKSGDSKSSTKETKEDSSGGSESSAAYRKVVNDVVDQLGNERAHTPSPPSEDPPELPWKWADISDSDLHDLHMQFASLAYWTSYRQTKEERIGIHCKQAADELRQTLILKQDKYDEKNKPITVTVLEAQAESDPNVKAWRKRQHKHEQFALAAKRELESYHKLVESLSRLETMRHNGWERARR